MADNPFDKKVRAEVGEDDPEDFVQGQHHVRPSKGAHQGSADRCSKDHAPKQMRAFFQRDEKKKRWKANEKKNGWVVVRVI